MMREGAEKDERETFILLGCFLCFCWGCQLGRTCLPQQVAGSHADTANGNNTMKLTPVRDDYVAHVKSLS